MLLLYAYLTTLYLQNPLNNIRCDLHTSDPSSVSVDNEKRIEAYYGEKNLVDKEILFFLNAKRRIDSCMNYSRPGFAK